MAIDLWCRIQACTIPLWINTIAGSCLNTCTAIKSDDILSGQMSNSLDIWFILKHSIRFQASLQLILLLLLYFLPLYLSIAVLPIKSFNGFDDFDDFVMRHTKFIGNSTF